MPKGCQDRLILSLDLSLNGSAFAVLKPFKKSVRVLEMVWVDNSAVETDSLPEKLANIYFNLADLLSRHDITDVVREKGFSMHSTVTQKLFRVVGVVDFCLYCEGFTTSIPEIPPTVVKKTLTGKGKASKEEVADGILKHLTKPQRQEGIYFRSDDESDAVAVGIAYCIKNKVIES